MDGKFKKKPNGWKVQEKSKWMEICPEAQVHLDLCCCYALLLLVLVLKMQCFEMEYIIIIIMYDLYWTPLNLNSLLKKMEQQLC